MFLLQKDEAEPLIPEGDPPSCRAAPERHADEGQAESRAGHSYGDVIARLGGADEIMAGDVDALARKVTEFATAAIGCERVSVWLFTDGETGLECIDLYEATPARHSAGQVLHRSQYQNEFAALSRATHVDASDPMTDPRTAGYVDSYLKPLRITSMLDTVIRVQGRNLGLLCFEHVDRPHRWEQDEIDLAAWLAGKLNIALNIRLRSASEAALRESRDRMNVIFNAVSDAILVIDCAEYRILDANGPALRMFGYTREEMLGREVWTLSTGEPPYTPADGIAAIDGVELDGKSFYTWHCKDRDGRLFWGEGTLDRVLFGGAQVMLATIRDITRRKDGEDQLRASEARFRALVEQAPEAILVYDIDAERMVEANRLALDLFGCSREELLAPGSTHFDFDHLDRAFQEELIGYRQRALAGETVIFEQRITTLQGREMVIEARISRLPSSGSRLLRTSLIDVTERREAEERLRLAHTLLESEIESAPDGVLVFEDWERPATFNRKFLELWNIPDEVARRAEPSEIIAAMAARAANPAGFRAVVERLQSNPDMRISREMDLADGRVFECYTGPIRQRSGPHLGMITFHRDVTERKRQQDEIAHLATRDILTGLANRAVFVDALGRAIARAHRQGEGFAVLCLDLDHFKDINDTLGHPAGDLLLQAVAQRLRDAVRATDTVARLGGDEFAILQTGVHEPSDAALLAEKLLRALAEPFPILGNEVRTGGTIGVAVHGPESPDSESLLSHADVALYRAKADERGTFMFFTESMDTDVRRRVTMVSELHHALAAGQLHLVYQPQVELSGGTIAGLEALVRWNHPTRGMISPAEFIPLAETSGLMPALGRWVLHEACRQAKAWLDQGLELPLIAINVSGAQLKNAAELERSVGLVLAETGLPPSKLELELTESVLMDVSREPDDVLHRLRAAGVRLAIDDFGTGYSSLNYLRCFPVDRLKIAQDFLPELTAVGGSAVIVKAAIGLARELGIESLVEGVETEEQRLLVGGWGCRVAQGYHFSRPLHADSIPEVLARGHMLPPQAVPARKAA